MGSKLAYTSEGYPFYTPDDVQELKDYADQISLPAQLPGYVHEPYKQNMLEKTISVMTGQNGEERFQLWPEKMVRSAITLPVDVMSGAVPTNFGLRRNDFTDIPKQSVFSGQPNEELINRTQDLAGLTAGSTLMPKPAATAREVLATMPKMNRMEAMQRQNLQGLQLAADAEAGTALAAVKNANPFYSVLENSLANISMKSGTKEQWTNAFKKYGTTADELAATGLNDLPSGQIARADIEKHIAENKLELKEVNKGGNINVDKIAQLEAEMVQVRNELDKGRKGLSKLQYDDRVKEIFRLEELNNKYEALAQEKNSVFGIPTKYSKWQLPGGEPGSYREKLLTLPASSRYDVKIAEGAYRLFDNKINDWVRTPDGKVLKPYASDVLANRAAKGMNETAGSNPMGNFVSSHWSEPNVLVHTRTNDRYLPTEDSIRLKELESKPQLNKYEQVEYKQLKDDESAKGMKSLHVEEIQSDWHQKGRKEGYKLSKEQRNKLEPEFNKIDDKITASNDEAVMGHPDIREAVKMAVDKKIISKAEGETYLKYADSERVGAVPDAPFKDTSAWAGLAFKRLIRQAAEEGKDAISWTPGEAQAARYDLSKHIDKINLVPYGKGMTLKGEPEYKFRIDAFKDNGKVIEHFAKTESEIADVVGKEVAEKLLNNRNQHGASTVSGLDLKVGGEWTKKFYDKMLVDIANSIAKKFGGKVEQKNLHSGRTKVEVDKDIDNLVTELNKREKPNWADNIDLKDKHKALMNERLLVQDGINNIHLLRLTPELKKAALEKGFPLFTGGFSLAPIAGNPFDNKQKYKLTPVQGNPFNE